MSHSFRFGTVGSPKSTPPKPGGSVGAIHQLRLLNLDALELGWVQSVRVSESTCGLIAQAGRDQDVAISVHAPYFINLNATDEEWPKSRQRLMDAAHYGNLAGATDIIFHPGSYFGQPEHIVVKRAVERLRECVNELRSQGNPVTLRPETMGKSAMLGSIEDVIAMSIEIDGVKPCLDFAHLHARVGDGSMNSFEEWDLLLNVYAKSLGKQALKKLHIHLSGIEYGPKGEKNHLVLANSDFNVTALFEALLANQCAGRILCESPAMEDDAIILHHQWQSLLTP